MSNNEEYQKQQEALLIAYKNTFKTPDGERVLEHLMNTFDQDRLVTDNVLTTAERCGQRNVIRTIQNLLKQGEE